MEDNKYSVPYFKKNINLEDALTDLNTHIEKIVIDNKTNLNTVDKPIFMIMGAPRSGSTLMLQWLSSLGLFSYPSNLIARFYKNPYIGIRAQQALLEYDPLNQLGFNNTTVDFTSQLGKTMGALNPSEFWYFWRNHFKLNGFSEVLNLNDDFSLFLNQLKSFEYLTGKPLALKGMLLFNDIPLLHKISNKIIFINLKRDTFFNAQSLLFAREKYFNDTNKWYSFKPKEYELIKHKDPISQVAGQVVFIKNAIEKGLKEIPKSNKLEVDYEDFCLNPIKILNVLKDKCKELNYNLEIDKVSPKLLKPFKINNSIKLNTFETKQLNKELNKYK